MKQVLVLLLLCPLLSAAQHYLFDSAYIQKLAGNPGEPIRLPRRDYNPHFSIPDTGDYNTKSRTFVVSDDSTYRKLFWRHIYTPDSIAHYRKNGASEYYLYWMETHLVDSLPAIDFSVHELVMYAACYQCLAYCGHDEEYSSCHRNACYFRESWFIRKKKIT